MKNKNVVTASNSHRLLFPRKFNEKRTNVLMIFIIQCLTSENIIYALMNLLCLIVNIQITCSFSYYSKCISTVTFD